MGERRGVGAEHDSILRQLWLAHSAQEVAAHITKATSKTTTKNAVISRARRLKLPSKSVGRRPNVLTPQRTKTPPRRGTAGSIATLIAAAADDGSRVRISGLSPTRTFHTLDRHECRFPIDIPSADRFGFCGRASDGHSYCDAHKREAYLVGPKRTGPRARDAHDRHPAR